MMTDASFHPSAVRRQLPFLGPARAMVLLPIAIGFLFPSPNGFGQGIPGGNDAATTTARYAYYYGEQLIGLNPSDGILAIQENDRVLADWVRANSLERDPHSEHGGLHARGLGLYRRPGRKGAGGPPAGLLESVRPFAAQTTGVVQPVFEQGPALLIPSNEIIVGFAGPTTLAEARDFFAPRMQELGIAGIRPHRKNTFLVTIANPGDGRGYAVCQALAPLNPVAFAEPNHIVIMLDRPIPPRVDGIPPAGGAGDGAAAENAVRGALAFGPQTEAATSWVLIDQLDFESTAFPPAGWTRAYTGGGARQANWGVTSYRSHTGTGSLYCALEGSAGVPPPGPAPTRMGAILRSPTYDLTAYEEVYLEVWFYAINELFPDPGGNLYDYGLAAVFNSSVGTGFYLGTAAAGDCTIDPTTDSGWRRCLLRVPSDFRVANAYFEFRYISDVSVQKEGCYLDDVRIVATTDVDTEPLGGDPYGARHWDMKNAGQIAGLGGDDNDMHVSPAEAWSLASVSTGVVVAVIDTGVDLTHPDLNLVTGYNSNGSVGGAPQAVDDNHGTACAGEVGAILNNTPTPIGVIGVAPNCQIMPVHWGVTFADLANAIDVAVLNGADVLSNSWGWLGSPSAAVESAINDALTSGRVVVFAAGNGPDRPPWTYDVVYPGYLTGSIDIICVGASSMTDEHKAAASTDGEFYWGSSYVGSGPDVCAPGSWSYTTDRQGAAGYNDGSADPGDPDYISDFGGTSSSTPKVAGVAALLLSANPNLTPGQVKAILRATADDIDVPGVDDKTGAGRVNAYRALRSLTTVDAPTTPQPDLALPEWRTTEVDKMTVLKFRVTDHGEDGWDTLIDRIEVAVAGTAGFAANDIAWAELHDGSTRVALASSITDTAIVFGGVPNSDGAAQLDAIPDNTYVEYDVNIYLNTSLLGLDGQTYVFDTDEMRIGVDANASSQMAGDSGAVAPVTGTLDRSEVQITVSPNAWPIGPQSLGAILESTSFTVTNNGSVAEDFAILGDDALGGWLLENAAGADAFRVDVDQNADGTYEIILTTSDQTLFTNVAGGGTSRTIRLKYAAPTSDTKGGGVAQDFVITLKASQYVP